MLNPFYHATARAIVAIHGALAHVFGSGGWAWALSIVVLTMGVRLVLVPLFVKQIKAQRTMQVMQPKIREIKEKYKDNKQRQNEEILKLQREHGNPLLGCLPILVQIPLFFALFHTLDSVVPKSVKGTFVFHGSTGLSAATASAIAHAQIFGASLASSFTSSASTLRFLGSNATTTKIFTVLLIVIMMVTTFITQKQIFGRNAASADPAQARQQKVLLYLSPLFLGVFGFRFPVGVLLYWFTTNVWSMGQQYIVLRRMGPTAAPATSSAPAANRRGSEPAGPQVVVSVEPRAVVPGRTANVVPAEGADRPVPGARRPSGGPTRPPRRRTRGGRRGGRR